MKTSLAKTLLLLAFGASLSLQAQATEGVTIERLSPVNTLVRLQPTARYLMLPVEESVPDAKIELLRDGEPVKTFYVRLAANHADFLVPFDLQPYLDGSRLALNVVTSDDRGYARDAADNFLWDQLSYTSAPDVANREQFRPAFHHTPEYGWMNDPNGMFYRDGEWHLYYQYNPYGSKWQNMTWGHSSSSDLVHWTRHPLAIEPDGLGSVFSGSSVVDTDNTAGFGSGAVVALFTSAGVSQTQSLAHSVDGGTTFTRFPGNPVVTTYGEARDPNIFWYEPTGRWIMLLAHALDREMLIYSSSDLKEWTFESAFGKGYGCQEGVWECPDLFELPVRGSDGQSKWVLICNINPGAPHQGSGSQYFVGDFDGHTFTCQSAPSVTKWMDYGKDHYAAVSFSNAPEGRHTTLAWMSNWEYANEVPTTQYRGANTLPRDHDLFVGPDGELYLGVMPAAELDAMRGRQRSYGSASISAKGRSYTLPADGLCEIVVDIDPRHATGLELTLSNARGESVVMTYDLPADTFAMDRRHSGLTDFSSHFPAVTTAPMLRTGGRLKLRLYVDRSSIEAFDGDGRFAMTNLVFPTEPFTTLSVKATGSSARLEHLDVYPL